MHVVAEGHEIAVTCPIPAGAFSVVHVVTPLVVTTTSPDSMPIQSLVEAQLIPLRPPGVGEDACSTCQELGGPTAEAGDTPETPTAANVSPTMPATVSRHATQQRSKGVTTVRR